MSAIALLMGLLVLSYLGSLLVGSGKTRGLASGVEYIALGILIGPHVLGVVSRTIITDFQPVVEAALGWLAFVVGLDFGRVEGRRVSRRTAIVGIASALATGGVVALSVRQALASIPIAGIDGQGATILAAGAGAVSAETARYAVEWVGRRWGAKGPITRLLVDIGAADDLVPLVAVGVIFSLSPAKGLSFVLPAWGWFSASFLLGGLLGVVTAMLLRGAEGDAVWGALIGTLLLVVGTAARFGLCTIFVTFVMGIGLAAASPNRRALRRMVGPTERGVLNPMLLLAGARLDPSPLVEHQMLAAIVALVLVARIFAKIACGLLLRATTPAVAPAGPMVGIVLLSSGPISMSCGLVAALRFPGPVGETLLVCATASAVLGELVSTLSLRGLLTEAGEIVPVVAPPPKTPSTPPPPPESQRMLVADLGEAEDQFEHTDV